MINLQKSKSIQKLSLFAAVMMVIGGQIGGGIFGALGPAMKIADKNVVLAFLYGGILSLITAYSYSRIAIFVNDDGGSYFEDFYPRSFFNAFPSWLLLFGYLLTMGLYANTFGNFLAEIFGGSTVIKHAGIILILGFFMLINWRGIHFSAVFENVLVMTKLSILAIFILAGLGGIFWLNAGNAALAIPQVTDPLTFIAGIIVSSSVIFVAYEGLELAAVNYAATRNPKKNMPKAILIGPLITLIIYLLVSFVAKASLTADQITLHQETALAIAAQPALGKAGFAIISLGALISTASAILATMFGVANLSKDLADSDHLPKIFGKLNQNNVPGLAIIIFGFSTGILANSMNLTGIAAFASAAFLLIFTIVNYLAIKIQKQFKMKLVHISGSIFTLVSLAALFYYLRLNDGQSLSYIAGGFAATFVLYLVFKLSQAISLRSLPADLALLQKQVKL